MKELEAALALCENQQSMEFTPTKKSFVDIGLFGQNDRPNSPEEQITLDPLSQTSPIIEYAG